MAGTSDHLPPRRDPEAATRRRPAAKRRPATRRRRAVAGSRKRARRKKGWDAKRWWPALVIAAAVLVGRRLGQREHGGPDGALDTAPSPGSSLTLTAEQVANAKTIASVAREPAPADRAVVIALATAQQESRLRNLDYGDRDSLGLFQQRPSSGWGTPAQVQDPVYAAGKFYDHLVEMPGWETGRSTEVARPCSAAPFRAAYGSGSGWPTTLAAGLWPPGTSHLLR